jgi:DNA-binding MarR family transcriptional regulator
MVELTAAQQRAWRALVIATHTLDEALDRQSRRDGGIPHAYYKILVFLYESGDRRLAMSELAAHLRYSPSRLAHAVASLERSGWARRVRSTDDRRVQFAELTSEGAAIVRAVTPGQVTEVRHPVLDALSAQDAAALERIASAISAALAATE